MLVIEAIHDDALACCRERQARGTWNREDDYPFRLTSEASSDPVPGDKSRMCLGFLVGQSIGCGSKPDIPLVISGKDRFSGAYYHTRIRLIS